MNKLQRYWAEESGIYNLTTDDCEMGDTCRLVCKDADVSALEAENERLREALMRLFKANSTASSAVTLIAALEHAKAILNREQEKQP